MSAAPASHSVDHGLMLLRIALGTMYVAHALLKLLTFTLPGTAQFFESVGLPGVLAYPVFAAELVGGALLVAGVYARQVAIALVPILVGALAVHASNGWVFTASGGGWEYPAFLIAASIALWIGGDGTASLARSRRFVPAPARS